VLRRAYNPLWPRELFHGQIFVATSIAAAGTVWFLDIYATKFRDREDASRISDIHTR
jgi:hypothetical protein